MNRIILLLSFCLATLSWGPTGHFIIARVAEVELMKSHNPLYQKLIELLKVIGSFTKEKEHPFVESACYVDDIKAINWKAFNAFHFYDLYIPGDGKNNEDLKKLPKSKVNMASAVADARETLRNTRKTQVDDRLGKSIMLRFLIHLVGDVHQPLHAVSRVSKQHPQGDAGGNAFELSKPKSKLHTYWDKTLGFYSEVKAPLSDGHFTKVREAAEQLMSKYPRKDLADDLKIELVSKWIEKGKNLAKDFAYKGIEEGGEATEAYRQAAKPVIERQLILGGYRLADLIIDTYKNGKLDDYFSKNQVTDFVEDDESEDDANVIKKRGTETDGEAESDDDDVPPVKNIPIPKKPAQKIATLTKKKLPPKSDQDKPAKAKVGPKGKLLKKKVDGWYTPSSKADESDFDDQNEATEEDEEDLEGSQEDITEKKGFFGRFFTAIANFFRRLFGG